MSTTWDDEAALARREDERDHAEHLVRMLRVTMRERIGRASDTADRLGGDSYWQGMTAAYEDVAALLGPEEAELYDPLAPF